MQIKKIALLLLMMLSVTVNVFAAGPLEQETGSISVTMQHDGKAVAGGTLTAYHVARPMWQDDDYVFVYTQEFIHCDLPIANLNDDETVYQFADFVADNRIEGHEKSVDANGRVCFDELPLGLYLVVQQQPAEGYYGASPFLITVPVEAQDGWNYDVDASPKVEVYKEPEPTTPTTPSTPGTPSRPPSTPNIPQTGQLKWPIPVLSIAGLLLFVLGWVLCFRKKEEKR